MMATQSCPLIAVWLQCHCLSLSLVVHLAGLPAGLAEQRVGKLAGSVLASELASELSRRFSWAACRLAANGRAAHCLGGFAASQLGQSSRAVSADWPLIWRLAAGGQTANGSGRSLASAARHWPASSLPASSPASSLANG